MSEQATKPPRCQPPLPHDVCARAFPGRRDQVSAARAFLTPFLHGSPLADDAVLLVSELAANACAHSASGWPGGQFTVRAGATASGIIYGEVEDQGSSWDGTLRHSDSPHGLYLLRALSDQCGTRLGAQGWVTWFVIGPRDD